MKAREEKAGNKLPLLIASGAAIALLFALSRRFDLEAGLEDLRAWIGALGPWGPAVFALVYIAGIVLAISAPLLSAMAGVLFGPVWGIVLVSLSATAAVTICFFISRYLAREAVYRWLSEHEKFQRIDELTEKHGWLVVALARLVPILPFPVINYGFGLTKIPARVYIFFSWLCMLPGTAVIVLGTTVFSEGFSRGRVPWAILAGLAGAVILLLLLVRAATKRLQAGSQTTGESL